MESWKGSLGLGIATGLLITSVATTFGTELQSPSGKHGSMTNVTARTSATHLHTKRQSLAMRKGQQRSSAHRLRTSAKKVKRVPRAKSLSKESY